MKKALSMILAVLMVIGLFPFSIFATDGTLAKNDMLVRYLSDPVTLDKPSEFGTAAANGRIWTDKSVSSDITDGTFDITLSALAQEYKYTLDELYQYNEKSAADVLFILDFSKSMVDQDKLSYTGKTGGLTRFEALVEAVNLAMKEIMTANIQNRVMICVYNANQEVVVPLGSYVVQKDGDYTTEDDYFYITYRKNNASDTYSYHTINTVSGFSEIETNGNIVNKSYSKENVTGTKSQYGIAYACEQFISSVNNAGFDGIARKPFVLFMTDGFATQADKRWWESSSVLNADSSYKVSGDGSTHTTDNEKNGNSDRTVAALTLLTAAYQKNQIINKYNEMIAVHNAQPGLTGTDVYKTVTDLEWFNVGIAVKKPETIKNTMGLHCMMNPTLIDSTISDSSNTKRAVYEHLITYTKPETYSGLSLTDPQKTLISSYSPTASNKYVYTSTPYVTFAETGDAVAKAFADFGSKIASMTKNTVPPVKIIDNIIVTFTDIIGSGMELEKDASGTPKISMSLKGNTYKVVPGADGKYLLKNTASTGEVLSYTNVRISYETNTVITWEINEDDLPVIKFRNRTEPGRGSEKNMYVDADPIRLYYTVKPTDAAISDSRENGTKYYSNKYSDTDLVGTAYAEFLPAKGNSFYYITPTSTQKDLSDIEGNRDNKTANRTSTAAAVSANAFVNGVYKISLGNNGVAQAVASISIDGDVDRQCDDGTVIYTITATNFTKEPLENAVITAVLDDVTIESSDKPTSGAKNKWTVTIPASGTSVIKVTTTVDADYSKSGDSYDVTQQAQLTYNGDTAAVDNEVTTIEKGYPVTIKTYLDRSLENLSVIEPGKELIIKNNSTGKTYSFHKTAEGTYVSDASIPKGTYTVCYKDDETANIGSFSVTNSSVTKEIYWVKPTVNTYLDDKLTKVTNITGDTVLYLGAESIPLEITDTGKYKSSESILSPGAGKSKEFYIYDDTKTVTYDKLTVTDLGPNHQDLYWYTVDFHSKYGTEPDNQTVKKGSLAVDQPAPVTTAKYKFVDWYTDESFDTPFDFINTPITTTTDIYAKWVKTDIPVEYKKYVENEMPKTDKTGVKVDEEELLIIDPTIYGFYEETHDPTYITATDVSKIVVTDPQPVKGKIFAGWEVSYPSDNVTKLTARYYDDVVGDSVYPEKKGDGIADIFEKKVIYSIENGTWNGYGDTSDIIEYVPLYDSDGQYDVNGTGTLIATPETKYPYENYVDTGYWTHLPSGDKITNVPATVTGTETEEFHYKYDPVKTYPVTFSLLNNPDVKDRATLEYGKEVKINIPSDEPDTVYRGQPSVVVNDTNPGYDVPDPERPGYIFNGWKVSGDHDTLVLTPDWIPYDEGDLPIHNVDNEGNTKGPAVYEPVTVPEGNTIHVIPHPSDKTKNYDVPIEGPESFDKIVNPSENGKVFVGWDVSENDPVTGDVTLTARYEDDVKGDDTDPENKGDGVPDMFEKKIVYIVSNGIWDDGTTEKIEYVPLLDENNKWSKNGSGTLTIAPVITSEPNPGYVTEGSGWKFGNNEFLYNYKVTGTETEYHYYDYPTVAKYVVKYDSNGQVDKNNNTVLYEDDEKIYNVDLNLKKNTTWEGHTFYGWSENKNAKPGEGTMVYKENKDTTVYAIWTVNEHELAYKDTDGKLTSTDIPYGTKVHFIPNGGTFRSSTGETVVNMPDNDIDASPDPTWEGHTFIGWTISGPDPVTGDITLTANWQPDKKAEFMEFIDDNKDGDPDTDPEKNSVYTPYKKYLHIDPNGGTYNGTKSMTHIIMDADYVDSKMIGSPVEPKDKVFVGWKVTGPDSNGEYTLVAQYAADEVGDEDFPEDEGDGIADIFQKKIVYKIVGGTWDGKDDDDIIEYVTLIDKNGKSSPDGSAKLTFPKKMEADDGYDENSGEWSDNRPSNDTVKGTKTETFTYTYIGGKDIAVTYNKYTNSGASKTTSDMVYSRKLTVAPNGGKYNGTTANTVYDNVTEDKKVSDPTPPSGKEFVGWNYSSDSNGNVTLTAQYAEENDNPATGENQDILIAVFATSLLSVAMAVYSARKRKYN